MDIEVVLQQIVGLSSKESRVYASLLETGPATVSTIAKQTGLHRPAIYQVLPSLKEKGVVSMFPRGKQKLYAAESPQKLKHLFENFKESFEEVLPELEAKYRTEGRKPVVTFLEGKQGITSVFEDLVTSLKKDDVYYRYTSNKDLIKSDKYLPKNYRKVRDNKQLQRYIINNEKTAKQKKPQLDRSVKVIPQEYDLFEYDVSQIIYGDKVAFLDFNTETAFVIENAQIAEFQKKIFKLLYDRL